MLLLGAGAAHADDTALAPGQLDDLFSPAGGPNNQSLRLDANGDRIDTSAATTTEGGGSPRAGQQVPDVLRGLPLSSVLPTNSLGLPRTTSSRMPNLPGLPGLPGLPTNALPTGGLPTDGLTGTEQTGATEDSLGESTQATEADGLPLVGDMPLGGSDVLKNDSITGLPVVGGVGPTPGVSTTAVANRLVPTTGALPQATSQLPLVTEKAYAPKHSTMYSPKHAQTEALPVVGSLPLVGGLAGGGLPLVGGLPLLGG